MMEAGANSVQQLAFTLAAGIEYVRTAIKAGLDVDEFAPRLSFFFGIGMNFFMDIAMLRAARFLWHKLMGEFNPQNPKSSILRTHCQTSGWSLTEQDPYNNIIRTTLECMSAAFGGTQSLHTNSFDEAVSLPTDFSAGIARNTQLIVQEESQITRVVDPLAGSYYLESLTSSMVNEVQKILDEVESMGGMVRAIENGMPKRRIEESSARRQARIDQGKEIILGVNKYNSHDQGVPEILEVPSSVRDEQIERLKSLKASRDNAAVEKALQKLTFAAENGDNLLEAAIPAARLRATVGEMSEALEKVFGRYIAEDQCISGFYADEWGDDESFGILKKRVSDFSHKHGSPPKMMVAKMGQDGHDRGSKVIATAYGDFGFEVTLGPLFQTPEETALLAVENRVHIIGVSTLAAGHKILVPELMRELEKLGRTDIKVIVGGVIPSSDYDYLKQAGVSAVFGPGTAVTDSAKVVLNLLEA